MIIGIIIAVVLAGGASFAAENSLPGDILYPVKIHVNEEVRAVVALDAEAKIRAAERRALLRLEEAEKLEAKGKLDAEVTAEIAARFKEHAEALSAKLEKVHAEGQAEVHSNFESAIEAREAILIKLSERSAEINAVLGKIRMDHDDDGDGINTIIEGEVGTAREAASGQATGREAGTGKATGKVQVQSGDVDGDGTVEVDAADVDRGGSADNAKKSGTIEVKGNLEVKAE
jgi:hypothetical protein